MARLPATGPGGQSIGDQIRIGPVKVIGRNSAATRPTRPLLATFADQIDLLGYDLDPATREPGASFALTLYWRARGRPSADYTVFVHYLDSGGRLLAQADSPPQAGSYPTSLWDSDEVIADVHRVPPAPAGAPGPARFEVGLYELASGRRVAVVDVGGGPAGDFVVVPVPAAR